MRYIMALLFFIATPVLAITVPIKNITDRCTCYFNDKNPNYCDSVNSARIVGAYKDKEGIEIIPFSPGQTIDAPAIPIAHQVQLSLRLPGPVRQGVAYNNLSFSRDYFADMLPPIAYAVTVYIRSDDDTHYYPRQVIELFSKEELMQLGCSVEK